MTTRTRRSYTTAVAVSVCVVLTVVAWVTAGRFLWTCPLSSWISWIRAPQSLLPTRSTTTTGLRTLCTSKRWTQNRRDHLFASTVSYQPETLPGVSVTRSFTLLPHGTAKIELHVDGHVCEQHDTFGDNVCHWDWNATLGANIHSMLEHPIEEGDYIQGNVKIDGFIPYHFQCMLCGEDCTLTLPLVNANFTIPTSTNCPVPVGEHSKRLVGQLWPSSPTGGTVTTSFDVTLLVVQAKTNTKLMEMKLQATVK